MSFRREKYVPFGGPDGGDGGDGGDVIIATDRSITQLREFRQNKLYRAENGSNGRGKKQHGKRGRDLVLKVPEGTVVMERGSRELLADCDEHGQKVVVASGGRGGIGNTHFASSTNQAPLLAQKGEQGEEYSLNLELRLIADVGIIGYPNAGKSTLLANASAAKPKVAGYPFTTLEPVLGAVEVGNRTFVMAEIPGLIDGAHLGRGLGFDFLRHVMRTKILVHVVDGSSSSPIEDMARLNTELSLYDSSLAQKPQVVTVNKIDLPEVRSRMNEIGDSFRSISTNVLFISAASGEGIDELLSEVLETLTRAEALVIASEEVPKAVIRPEPRSAGISVHKEGDIFVVVAPELERIVARVDMNNPEVRRQLQGHLTRLGGKKALEKAGIQPGDKVRCGNAEWEW